MAVQRERTKDQEPGQEIGQKPPAAEPKGARIPKLEEQLVYLGERAGAGIALVAPVTGLTFVTKTPMAAQGLMLLARKNPALKRGLEALITGSAYSYLGDFVASVAVAAAVEFGRLSPDALLAQFLGVTEIVEQVQASAREAQEGGEEEVEPYGTPEQDGGGLLTELRSVAGAAGAA